MFTNFGISLIFGSTDTLEIDEEKHGHQEAEKIIFVFETLSYETSFALYKNSQQLKAVLSIRENYIIFNIFHTMKLDDEI